MSAKKGSGDARVRAANAAGDQAHNCDCNGEPRHTWLCTASQSDKRHMTCAVVRTTHLFCCPPGKTRPGPQPWARSGQLQGSTGRCWESVQEFIEIAERNGSPMSLSRTGSLRLAAGYPPPCRAVAKHRSSRLACLLRNGRARRRTMHKNRYTSLPRAVVPSFAIRPYIPMYSLLGPTNSSAVKVRSGSSGSILVKMSLAPGRLPSSVCRAEREVWSSKGLRDHLHGL